MKRLSVIIVVICVSALYFSSCYYDNEEVLYPVFGCDSINVTYNNNISKIMNAYCTSCHSAPNPESGVYLTSWEDVRANEARITKAIKHTGQIDMPPGGMLNDCAIKQWDLWVSDEMPQ